MLAQGIQEMWTEWQSPMVMVAKKYGTMCLSIDFWKVNEMAKFDAYPVPQVEVLIKWIGGVNLSQP